MRNTHEGALWKEPPCLDLARICGKECDAGAPERVINLRTVERHAAGRHFALHRGPGHSELFAGERRRISYRIGHGARQSRNETARTNRTRACERLLGG